MLYLFLNFHNCWLLCLVLSLINKRFLLSSVLLKLPSINYSGSVYVTFTHGLPVLLVITKSFPSALYITPPTLLQVTILWLFLSQLFFLQKIIVGRCWFIYNNIKNTMKIFVTLIIVTYLFIIFFVIIRFFSKSQV